MLKDQFYREALREWRRKHSAEMFGVLDFIYLPEKEQAEILEQAYHLRVTTETIGHVSGIDRASEQTSRMRSWSSMTGKGSRQRLA